MEKLQNGEDPKKHKVMVYMNSGRLKKDMLKACALLYKINLGIEAFKDEPALYDFLHDEDVFDDYSNPLASECLVFKETLDKQRKEYIESKT